MFIASPLHFINHTWLMMPAEVPWFCNLIDGQLFRNHCIMDKSSGWLPLNTALNFWISLWNTIKPSSVWKNCSQKFGKTVNIYCLVWFFLVGTFQWISWSSLQNQFKSRRSISEESSLLSFPFILTGTGPPEVKCMTWNLLFLFLAITKGNRLHRPYFYSSFMSFLKLQFSVTV